MKNKMKESFSGMIALSLLLPYLGYAADRSDGALAQAERMADVGEAGLARGYDNAVSGTDAAAPLGKFSDHPSPLKPVAVSQTTEKNELPASLQAAIRYDRDRYASGLKKTLAVAAGTFGAVAGFVFGLAFWPVAAYRGIWDLAHGYGEPNEQFIFPITAAVRLATTAYQTVMGVN